LLVGGRAVFPGTSRATRRWPTGACAKNPPEQTWTVASHEEEAERLGTVEAATEEEAIDRAMVEFQIRDVDRFRISVQRS